MAWLLDTNAVIAVLRDPAAPIGARIRAQVPAEVAIGSIVLHELYYGAYRSARMAHNLALVEALRFIVLEFDAADARAAGEVRAVLGKVSLPIGPYDALIAGQALARGLVLVTRNTREFARVPGLRLEDWEAG